MNDLIGSPEDAWLGPGLRDRVRCLRLRLPGDWENPPSSLVAACFRFLLHAPSGSERHHYLLAADLQEYNAVDRRGERGQVPLG